MADLTVIGGGLAGCEAAWQAAERGLQVDLYEMRPGVATGAHTGDRLAELVCSNSFGSQLPDRAPGVLKAELQRLGSLLLRCAEETALPAGGALAVDRIAFAQRVTDCIAAHPRIRLVRLEVRDIPTTPTVIASGPLTSPALAGAIARLTGADHLYFYDAIAPIVSGESINMQRVFRASRLEGKQGRRSRRLHATTSADDSAASRGSVESAPEESSQGASTAAGLQNPADPGDYLNCPMDRDQYYAFIDALLAAERIELREFEADLERGVRGGPERFFEGCLPIEIMAQRGRDTPAFGPMRPVGLFDPHTGRRPFAVVQLRRDNLAGDLYNLVGFQTNLKFSEQKRVLALIPGLEQAEIVRYGQMHRNTFIFSPALLLPNLQARQRPDLFFAGQITGIEGYVGNIASGLVAGLNAAKLLRGEPSRPLPETTLLGALCHYVTHAAAVDFQPMKANFGLLPPLTGDDRRRRQFRDKRLRFQTYAARALADLDAFLAAADPAADPGGDPAAP